MQKMFGVLLMFDRILNSIKCVFCPTEVDFHIRAAYRTQDHIRDLEKEIRSSTCYWCQYLSIGTEIDILESKLKRINTQIRNIQRKQNGKKKK